MSFDLQLNNLSLGQTELVTAVHGLQATHNDLTAHFQHVENGLAEVPSKQAKVDTEYEELKKLIGATKSGDSEMPGVEVASQEKKRKIAERLGASVASGNAGIGGTASA